MTFISARRIGSREPGSLGSPPPVWEPCRSRHGSLAFPRLARFRPPMGSARARHACQRLVVQRSCTAAPLRSCTTRPDAGPDGSARGSGQLLWLGCQPAPPRPPLVRSCAKRWSAACSPPIDKFKVVPEGTPPALAAWDDRVISVSRCVPYAAGANLQGKEVSRRNDPVHQHSSCPFPPRG